MWGGALSLHCATAQQRPPASWCVGPGRWRRRRRAGTAASRKKTHGAQLLELAMLGAPQPLRREFWLGFSGAALLQAAEPAGPGAYYDQLVEVYRQWQAPAPTAPTMEMPAPVAAMYSESMEASTSAACFCWPTSVKGDTAGGGYFCWNMVMSFGS